MSGEREHDIYKRRSTRNLAVGLGLGLMVLLIFAVTLVRLQENVMNPMSESFSAQHRYRDADHEKAAAEAAAQAESAVGQEEAGDSSSRRGSDDGDVE